jgi:hypothetical protein
VHLKPDDQGRTVLRLEEFVADLRRAVERWEDDVREDQSLRDRVLANERRNPVFEIMMIMVPDVLPGVTLMPVTSPMTTASASASGAIYPNQIRRS